MWEVKCFSWIDRGEYRYCCCSDRNALIKINIDTHEVYVIGSFPGFDYTEGYLSWGCVEVENRIWFIPFRANHIAIYDNRSIEYVEIPLEVCKGINYNEDQKFLSAIEYGDYIFLIGFCYPGILRIDKKTYKIDVFDDWMKRIIASTNGIFPDSYFGEGVYVFDGRICVPMSCHNTIFEFNPYSLKWDIFDIDGAEDGFFAAYVDEKEVYLTSISKTNKNVYRLNKSTKELYSETISELSEGLHIIRGYMDNLYVSEFRGRDICKLILRDKYIEKKEMFQLKCKKIIINGIMADKNGIYVNDDNDGIWHLVSPDGGCTEDIFVISDENYKNNYKKDMRVKLIEHSMNENPEIKLKEFIEAIE